MSYHGTHWTPTEPAEQIVPPQASAHPRRRLRQKPGISQGLRKGLVWSALGASVIGLLWMIAG